MLVSSPNSRIHPGPLPSHDIAHPIKIEVEEVSFWYGAKQALKHVSLDVFKNEVLAFIGPSGCGKSTLLRCLNRTNELVENTRMEGCIRMDGADIYADDVDPPLLRARFGWIAQKPNPFPWSIYANIAYGAQIVGAVFNRREADELVEHALRAAGLWAEVKDRLGEAGTDLSGGQQQRLCIARAIATNSIRSRPRMSKNLSTSCATASRSSSSRTICNRRLGSPNALPSSIWAKSWRSATLNRFLSGRRPCNV